ncbi:MAG: hypothetical protein R3B40_19310 [Polyangiales bacterium]|nr:hypothetical protein [Sandaracinaceae bacterium]
MPSGGASYPGLSLPATDLAPVARKAQPRDRDNPGLFHALSVDPTLPMDPASVASQVRDAQRWTRRYLFPTVKVLVLVALRLVLIVKRVLPVQLSSQRLLSWGSVFFGRWFASPEAAEFILRHFVIETQIVNFIARNAGRGDVAEVDLLPTRPEHLGHWDGMNATIRHDVNVFNLVIDLGESEVADVHARVPLAQLDFGMLAMPPIDTLPDARRLLSLDTYTTLYVSCFWIAFCADEPVLERAINSFQFDESLLTTLANLTGDDTFRSWTPVKFPTWLGSPTFDPARDLHWHMLVHEYAYHQLLRHRAAQAALSESQP